MVYATVTVNGSAGYRPAVALAKWELFMHVCLIHRGMKCISNRVCSVRMDVAGFIGGLREIWHIPEA